MRKLHSLLALALLGASNAALSQTLPLNTGFDYSNFSVYLAPGPTTPDNYWIKVAGSNGPLNVPAFVINKHGAWQQPMSGGGFGSQWVSSTSPSGTSPSNQINWAVYRKCFCLMRGYKEAKMNFQIVGDDVIGVWLNNHNILPVQGGYYAGPPVNGTATASQFRTGRNCLYVLVVDTGSVVTGFNLAGSVSAYGVMPTAAAGAAMSFKPCTCEGPAVAAEQATIRAITNAARTAVPNAGATQVPAPAEGPRPR